jgi:hypothetical protein
MHRKPLASEIDRRKLRMDVSHMTGLITAWTLIKPNLTSHARNIFASFYEQNPEYLRLFDNDPLHSHSEKVLQSFTALIDEGLQSDELFDSIMEEIVKHHEHISRQDVIKLNEIIRAYVSKVLKRHMTRTLREALDSLFVMVESRFPDSSDMSEEI